MRNDRRGFILVTAEVRGQIAHPRSIQPVRISAPRYQAHPALPQLRPLFGLRLAFGNACRRAYLAPAHLVDPSLAQPPPADDYADGSWTDWLDTSTLKRAAYLSEVVGSFREHTKVTLVRLLRLEPGAVVKEHTDPTLALEERNSVVRLTIPIQTNEGVEFFLNGTPVPMRPGECWYLRLSDPHRIVNAGATERINMSIDMVPNDWVRSLVENDNILPVKIINKNKN